MSELVAVLQSATRADLQRLISAFPGLSPMMRAAAGGALAFVSEADFQKYRGLVIEGYMALTETERGRAVLAALGVDE